jgi:hypothetical protein
MSLASAPLSSKHRGVFTLGARGTGLAMVNVLQTVALAANRRRRLRGAVDVTRAHSLARLAERLASTVHRHHHCPHASLCCLKAPEISIDSHDRTEQISL